MGSFEKPTEAMRTLYLILLFALITTLGMNPAHAQSVGDTAIVRATEVRIEPSLDSDVKFELDKGSFVVVQDEKGRYYRVQHDKGTGWILDAGFMSEKGATEYRAKRKRRRKLIRQFRQKGYTVVIANQTFEKNSAGGIDIGLGLVNISETKTVKYATATWQLYNPVGDPAENGLDSSTATTRFVGPLEPEEVGHSTFENVWYSNVGSCAELKKLVVEHIDGSSFTYVNDLKDIAQLSESVRLDGDCSYEAQQKRKN